MGSDCTEGIYAGWMKGAESNFRQNEPPKPLEMPVYELTMVGRMSEYL